MYFFFIDTWIRNEVEKSCFVLFLVVMILLLIFPFTSSCCNFVWWILIQWKHVCVWRCLWEGSDWLLWEYNNILFKVIVFVWPQLKKYISCLVCWMKLWGWLVLIGAQYLLFVACISRYWLLSFCAVNVVGEIFLSCLFAFSLISFRIIPCLGDIISLMLFCSSVRSLHICWCRWLVFLTKYLVIVVSFLYLFRWYWEQE